MLSVPCVALRRGHALSGSVSIISLLVKQQIHVRSISTKDVFNLSGQASALDIPSIPVPPIPARSIQEIVEAGESALSELGLISWWKPSSYFRIALESVHTYGDLPWWATIITATIILRLILISVPIMSQRLVAKQSKYKKELDEFRQRMDDARNEGNNLLQQQIFLEQRDFLKSKDIRLGRQLLIMLANGGVFATQFFAIKKMVEVNYPGLSTGGALWFSDMTVADPYYVLPLVSAVTMGIVTRFGIEVGTSYEQMTPGFRLGMQYGLPVIIFAVSSQFASALCVYWCTSNFMSLIYAGGFKIPVVRKLLNIPAVVRYESGTKKNKNSFKELLAKYKANKATPPSLAELRERDAQQFKKAGRGKPIVK